MMTDNAKPNMKPRLRQIAGTYLATVLLAVLAGAILGLIFSRHTEEYLRIGLVIVLAGPGLMFSHVLAKISRASESDRSAVQRISPLVAIMFIVPVLVIGFLYGLL